MKNFIFMCTIFRKFKSKKEIVLCALDEKEWKPNISQDTFEQCIWELQVDLKMFASKYLENVTSEFVKLSIGLRAPQIYDDVAPKIMQIPEIFKKSLQQYFEKVDAHIPIVAGAKNAIDMMLKSTVPPNIQTWVSEIKEWKKSYPINMHQYQGMTPEIIIKKINEMFKNSVVITDVGQNQLWTTQYMELDENRQMLTSGGFGTMGYGFPAAIGAKLGNPDKDVICISGDGGMQMNIQAIYIIWIVSR